ncbi:MAG TPA: TIGR03790 family protein [Candidatus Paceibacterota bacterium]|nr:TIGR03790 family protein [Candidatus Paceibacterota bacterium]
MTLPARTFTGLLAGFAIRLWAGGDEVVVVYNTDVRPDSRLVAQHYTGKRAVPDRQVIGLSMPRDEGMTRTEFEKRLQEPLLAALEQRGLLTFHDQIVPATDNQPGRVVRLPVAATVRYVALCYGVPVRILEDAKPTGTNKTLLPAQRRAAAVDSELALLPALHQRLPVEGMLRNPFLGTEAMSRLDPKGGLLMVTRLDGPSGSVARNLVDNAMTAETHGLWGRAYFDARGLTKGGYKVGDDWIIAASAAARRHGFETTLNLEPATFGTGCPLPQVALYAGWYDQTPSGPFKQSTVEFMPGAIAYHIFSYSARSIRTADTWVGCLLDRGAAATVGFVTEPYLESTIEVGVWFSRLIESGATFGEATYAALPSLSWQTTVIGDPIYRPFPIRTDSSPTRPPALPESLVPWSRLREINLRLVRGDTPDRVAQSLARAPETRSSALLEQKVGDLCEQAGKLDDAVAAYRRALALRPSDQQRVHLQLGLARLLTALRQSDAAISAYEQFLNQNPKYPDRIDVYRKALLLAREIKNESLIRRYEAEIQYLTPPPPATNAPPPAAKAAAPAKPK